ncbi:MAG: 30S ribosomal protein S5 [Candidatus Anstonellales archaeon]
MAELEKPDLSSWEPRTKLGKAVKEGRITRLEEIFSSGRKILEPEIVDALLPSLEYENIEMRNTQRMTDSGRRTQFRSVVIVGDKKGHVGVGVGKSEEVRLSLENAIADAKSSIISIPFGCGSWECKCSIPHSIPKKGKGKWGATTVELKPAPRGTGLVANKIVKAVLKLAGIKDVWSKANGGSGSLAMAKATVAALVSLSESKPLEVLE